MKFAENYILIRCAATKSNQTLAIVTLPKACCYDVGNVDITK